jgi:hypothetical protein
MHLNLRLTPHLLHFLIYQEMDEAQLCSFSLWYPKCKMFISVCIPKTLQIKNLSYALRMILEVPLDLLLAHMSQQLG